MRKKMRLLSGITALMAMAAMTWSCMASTFTYVGEWAAFHLGVVKLHLEDRSTGCSAFLDGAIHRGRRSLLGSTCYVGVEAIGSPSGRRETTAAGLAVVGISGCA
jgi:hypothetical protein